MLRTHLICSVVAQHRQRPNRSMQHQKSWVKWTNRCIFWLHRGNMLPLNFKLQSRLLENFDYHQYVRPPFSRSSNKLFWISFWKKFLYLFFARKFSLFFKRKVKNRRVRKFAEHETDFAFEFWKIETFFDKKDSFIETFLKDFFQKRKKA